MKGEEDKLFDDFLRKSLRNYQVKPSPAIWKGILQKIPAKGIGRIPFSGGSSGLISVISGGILITSVAIYNHNSNKQHQKVDTSGTLTAQTLSRSSNDSVNNVTYFYNPLLKDTLSTNTDQASDRNENLAVLPAIDPSKGATSSNIHAGRPVTPSLMVPKRDMHVKTNALPGDEALQTALVPVSGNPAETHEKNAPPVALAMAGTDVSYLEEITKAKSDKSYYFDFAGQLNQHLAIQSDPLRQQPKTMKITKWKGDYAGSGSSVTAGIYYQPEWLNQASRSKYNTIRQSAGLSLAWKKRPFVLETGIGVMQEKAWQEYEVHYNKLLGTYNNLQFITFDSIGGQLVPHYHYEIDSVFDPHETNMQQSKLARYIYLQVPVLLGYEKSVGRSTFYCKAGPVFSLLINDKQDQWMLAPEHRILSIEGDHPDRLQTSWQWYLGAGYAYGLTDVINIFVEPSLRGYFNTPYVRKRKPNDNPLYAGFRTGISVNIDNFKVK
jgi:hypothetical protein